MGTLKLGGVLVMVMVMMMGATQTKGMELCKMSEDGLTACKPAVTKADPVDPPSAECCEALPGADLACLCSYRNSFLLPSIGIDPDLAMALLAKCNPTPPATC